MSYMIRFEITAVKPGNILDVHGLVQKIVAPGTKGAGAGTIIAYVNSRDTTRFEKLLDADPCVASYFTHSTGDVDCLVKGDL